MTSTQDFMLAFAKAIIHNVDTRPQIVQQWTEKLEAREVELRRGFYERFENEYNELLLNGVPPESAGNEAAKRAAGLE